MTSQYLGPSNDVAARKGGKSAAITYTLIETAKLYGIDPQVYLIDVFGPVADYMINKINELLRLE